MQVQYEHQEVGQKGGLYSLLTLSTPTYPYVQGWLVYSSNSFPPKNSEWKQAALVFSSRSLQTYLVKIRSYWIRVSHMCLSKREIWSQAHKRWSLKMRGENEVMVSEDGSAKGGQQLIGAPFLLFEAIPCVTFCFGSPRKPVYLLSFWASACQWMPGKALYRWLRNPQNLRLWEGLGR